ncbi:uncharacterized protein ColSpa_11916 [Colletotrichum spaethianum]|uniref:Uncharacterized protein n=1 Tax=Colletotrichum spaethianum TaxID=700344 RepID=A0AA37UQ36_9PEZI|nr:uncharacterized protein ColSpa_11916 [Colletotrichum spaethianum]GKT51735.1 hypothetical protein ColSpa_11916 [Colletotrichum spaethianum]
MPEKMLCRTGPMAPRPRVCSTARYGPANKGVSRDQVLLAFAAAFIIFTILALWKGRASSGDVF